MARSITLANLISRIRARGDIRANRHSDAILTDWIRESWAELYDIMVGVNPDYFYDSHEVEVVSGTPAYSLPDDFYIALGLDYYGGGDAVALHKFNFGDRLREWGGGTDPRGLKYRIKGGHLMLAPTPLCTVSLWLYYIPSTSLTATTFDGISGWEEYVVADVCMKAAVADEEDYRGFLAAKQAAAARIKDMAAERDLGEPDMVLDVDTVSGDRLF